MDTKSETPRTDAVTFRAFEHDSKTELEACLVVPADEMAKLELELAAAKREMEELKRDKERLDWLERTNYSLNWDDDNVWIIWDGQKAYCGNLHGNIRTAFDYAMDNAMKEEK